MLQITGFDVVSTWLYPEQELSIVKVLLNCLSFGVSQAATRQL